MGDIRYDRSSQLGDKSKVLHVVTNTLPSVNYEATPSLNLPVSTQLTHINCLPYINLPSMICSPLSPSRFTTPPWTERLPLAVSASQLFQPCPPSVKCPNRWKRVRRVCGQRQFATSNLEFQPSITRYTNVDIHLLTSKLGVVTLFLGLLEAKQTEQCSVLRSILRLHIVTFIRTL
ncbi:hypothetical protein BDN72DRAFT_581514 [Pluteus cervinus]|uniref:Uncharacterized protein n=1 Tax=Pluteus cervinus TaxID=181527 RepID=A0ACD3A247_9AGAR|nr:hypothetical protein BDN72DRAFT_581514 [Pluteus cervinus]